MSVVEAIIFDCFGVFVDSNFKSFCERYVGGDAEKLEKVTILDEQACLGVITHEQFVDEIARTCRISSEEASTIISNRPADASLFEYIDSELYPKYEIGLLSNASSDWLDDLFTHKQLGLFKDTMLSFEVGLIKPDTDIYVLAAKRLGVTPAACVLVDDSTDNCKGAMAAGMQALQYQTFERFKADLSELIS